MEPNKSNIILIQENHPNIESTISCERCKSSLATIFCEECKPFQYFCDQCDTAVHNIISRKNHNRENLSLIDYYSNQNTNNKNINKNNKYNYNIYNEENKEMINNNENIDNMSIINSYKTPQNFSFRNINDNYIKIQNDEFIKKIYSKEYINELNNLHEKEKDELLNKISTLQNTIIRIKSSLNDEISKIKFTQITTEKEYNDKIDKIKLEYENKINNIKKEKDFQKKEIFNLNQIIKEQKKSKEELIFTLENIKINYDNLQNQFNLLNKEYAIFQKNSEHQNEFLKLKLNTLNEALIKINKEKEQDIEKIKLQKDIEIKELKLIHEKNMKNELDELNNTINEK